MPHIAFTQVKYLHKGSRNVKTHVIEPWFLVIATRQRAAWKGERERLATHPDIILGPRFALMS
jgi:hypothetical protein